MQLLTALINFLVYSDGAETNNPRIRDTDISRQLLSVPTGNSFSQNIDVPPASSRVVTQTLRTLSQDATTQYTVLLISGSTYRWLFAAGTNPVLRTKRSFAFGPTSQYNVTKVGSVIRFTHNGTGTAPAFVANGVVVGDILTIQAGTPFNALNQGVFTVVTVTATYIEVINDSGVPETGIALGANINGAQPMLIYSSAGVQVGDEVRITSTAFNIENRGIFTIAAVTSDYFELANGNPGIPQGPLALGSATGVVFYDDIYKWLYLESDQKVSIRLNGDTSDNVEVEPIANGDPTKPGVYLQRGGIFKLEVANNGDQTANIKIVLAE